MESDIRTVQTSIALVIQAHLDWLEEILTIRTNHYFGQEPLQDAESLLPAGPVTGNSPLDTLIRDFGFGMAERLVLSLSLAPLVKPQVLDMLFVKNNILDRGFTEFGGVKGQTFGGFIPTAETAMFLLAGERLDLRLQFRALFLPDSPLFERGILEAPELASGEPELSFPLVLTPEYRSLMLSGQHYRPDFSPTFPAKRMSTLMEWEDLVLEQHILNELDEIRAWIEHGGAILEDWKMKRVLKPGFRSLFYGPPGTGKTLTGTLLGKVTGKEVYRIDLSMIVSKWVGETEKNLANVFAQAENKDWILFFDEADAIFGKRTQTNSSNDRYANQQVSYLLQRIEDFPRVIILATNLKTNIDKAFLRRFQSIVAFTKPDKKRRYQLWENSLSSQIPREEGLDLTILAENYDLTGGEIINVVRHAVLAAYNRPDQRVLMRDLLAGIRKELQKEGRIFNPPAG